jgi:hypothetical protein
MVSKLRIADNLFSNDINFRSNASVLPSYSAIKCILYLILGAFGGIFVINVLPDNAFPVIHEYCYILNIPFRGYNNLFDSILNAIYSAFPDIIFLIVCNVASFSYIPKAILFVSLIIKGFVLSYALYYAFTADISIMVFLIIVVSHMISLYVLLRRSIRLLCFCKSRSFDNAAGEISIIISKETLWRIYEDFISIGSLLLISLIRAFFIGIVQ